MFVLYSFLKLVAVPIALVLVGMMFTPIDALCLIIGALTGLVGAVTLFFSLKHGLILILIGGAMFALGLILRRKAEREGAAAAEAAAETARRASRAMGLQVPPDE